MQYVLNTNIPAVDPKHCATKLYHLTSCHATCRYLQGILNTNCPALDLSAFTAVANAAADVGSSQEYNALQPDFTVASSPMNIFLAGFFLEDVTVGMYQNLIPSIVSRDFLIAATGKHLQSNGTISMYMCVVFPGAQVDIFSLM